MANDSAHSSWYSSGRWRKIRAAQLRKEPLCQFCLDAGRVVPGRVADHVVPHRGLESLFWHGKLQTLCYFHHNSTKREAELRGYVRDVGADGWPIDPRHPTNNRR